jgi:putative NADH-flavin reductase
MRIALFGASGDIGREVLAQAVAAGHTIIGVTRDAARLVAAVPPEVGEAARAADDQAPRQGRGELIVVEGDVRDPATVARAVTGAEAVISTLGATDNTASEADAAARAIDAVVTGMEAAGIRRLVALSGAAITLEGERKPLSGRVAGWVVSKAAHWVVEAKQREYERIRDSDLEWTLVRPPNVVPGPANPAVGLRRNLPAGSFRVSRGDVAAALLRCATEPIFVGEAPFVG